MERLKTHMWREFSPLILSPNQLRAIVEALAYSGKFEIIADDVRFDDIDEMIEYKKGGRPRVLTLESREPYLSLELRTHSSRLHAGSNEPISAGLFHKVSEILFAARRRPAFLYTPWFPVASLVALHLLLNMRIAEPLAFLEWPLFMVLTAVWIWGGYIGLTRHATINTSIVSDERPFWERRFDQIVLIIISALVGAFIMLGTQFLAQRLSHSTGEQTSSSPSLQDSKEASTKEDGGNKGGGG